MHVTGISSSRKNGYLKTFACSAECGMWCILSQMVLEAEQQQEVNCSKYLSDFIKIIMVSLIIIDAINLFTACR